MIHLRVPAHILALALCVSDDTSFPNTSLICLTLQAFDVAIGSPPLSPSLCECAFFRRTLWDLPWCCPHHSSRTPSIFCLDKTHESCPRFSYATGAFFTVYLRTQTHHNPLTLAGLSIDIAASPMTNSQAAKWPWFIYPQTLILFVSSHSQSKVNSRATGSENYVYGMYCDSGLIVVLIPCRRLYILLQGASTFVSWTNAATLLETVLVLRPWLQVGVQILKNQFTLHKMKWPTLAPSTTLFFRCRIVYLVCAWRGVSPLFLFQRPVEDGPLVPYPMYHYAPLISHDHDIPHFPFKWISQMRIKRYSILVRLHDVRAVLIRPNLDLRGNPLRWLFPSFFVITGPLCPFMRPCQIELSDECTGSVLDIHLTTVDLRCICRTLFFTHIPVV